MPLGGDIQDWFKSLPFFTRYWFGGTVLFTLLGRFGLLPASWLFLFWEPLWYKFQTWRAITAIFHISSSHLSSNQIYELFFRYFGWSSLFLFDVQIPSRFRRRKSVINTSIFVQYVSQPSWGHIW